MYNPLNPEDVKKLYALPKEEREQYIADYDQRVAELNRKMLVLVSEIIHISLNSQNQDQNKKKNQNPLFFLEYSVLDKMLKTKVVNGSAIFIPKFEDSILLNMITGCSTACIGISPLRMILFYEFMKDKNKLGFMFTLLHEAQHYARLHFKRRLNRDANLWNIATDYIINRSVLMDLHRYCKQHITRDIPDLAKNPQFFFNEEKCAPDDFAGVGFPNKSRSFLEKHDDRTWFYNEKFYKSTEEQIYSLIADEKTPNFELDMQKGSEMRNKGAGSSFDIFGEEEDRMRDRLKSLLKEYGTPQPSEDAAFDDETEHDLQDFIRDLKERKDKLQGLGTSDVEDIIKRDKEIANKLQFENFIKSFVMKRKGNLYRKSNQLTNFSRMTKNPVIQDLMGHKNQILLYKKENFSYEVKGLVICDTSGSVCVNEISKYYLNQIRDLVLDHGFVLDIVSADTESKNGFRLDRENFKQYEENGFPFKGGGGTDMLQPLAENLILNDYDIVFVLSDGCYESFTKNDLMNAMAEFEKTVQSPERIRSLNRRKNINGYLNPFIVLLNTIEMSYGGKFDSFKKTELQEYLLFDKRKVQLRSPIVRKTFRKQGF